MNIQHKDNDYKDSQSIQLASDIKQYLNSNNLTANLPDITYEVLALQLIESIEQEETIQALRGYEFNETCQNPKSDKFDPLKAIISLKDTDYDEACWLSFLLIYTDDGEQTDWAFMRKLYSGQGLELSTVANAKNDSNKKPKLTWQFVNDHPNLVNDQLETLALALAQSHPKPKFGHHRAYESLRHLPIVFSSYIDFINEQGGHKRLFKPSNKGLNKSDYFQELYALIRHNIYRFGRLSTFEYLCLLGKLGLAEVEPDSCYISEASGPKRGARLLFGMLNNEPLDDHAIGHWLR